MSVEGRWYVYALVDPRDGETFYIGKGQKHRARAHESSVRNGKIKNLAKSARIQQILDAGLSVDVRILQRFGVESEAYAFERQAIDCHAGLTNIAKGGQSGGGRRKGGMNRRSRELQLLARPYARAAINALIDVAINGKRRHARDAAARAILIRLPLLARIAASQHTVPGHG